MYEIIAQYYDLVHKDLKEDIRFLLKAAHSYDGQILELGCGTGRLVIPFAKAGHKISGIDHSPAMLHLGREKAANQSQAVQERITLIHDNMFSFELNENFDFAFFGHNTFMHTSQQQINSALKNIAGHLTESGMLFIDVDNPTEAADSSFDHLMILERSFYLPDSDDLVTQSASSWCDSANQIRHITWVFDRTPKAGGHIVRHVVETDFHYYYAHQLEIALEGAGFQLQQIFGDYDGSPYGDNSSRMIILAEKA